MTSIPTAGLPTDPDDQALTVSRWIDASPEWLFDAWTQPEHLVRWWGPMGTQCPEAAIDLRVGGTYRIANALPDGEVRWITGEYQTIERPRLLEYTWGFEPRGTEPWSLVSATFTPRDGGTEVTVRHSWLSDDVRPQHEMGWNGCLDGLLAYAATSQPQ